MRLVLALVAVAALAAVQGVGAQTRLSPAEIQLLELQAQTRELEFQRKKLELELLLQDRKRQQAIAEALTHLDSLWQAQMSESRLYLGETLSAMLDDAQARYITLTEEDAQKLRRAFALFRPKFWQGFWKWTERFDGQVDTTSLEAAAARRLTTIERVLFDDNMGLVNAPATRRKSVEDYRVVQRLKSLNSEELKLWSLCSSSAGMATILNETCSKISEKLR